MRRPAQTITLTLLFAAALTSTAVVRGDTVVLTNGDRLTGEVIERTPTLVVLRHATLGRVGLPMEKVQSVTVDEPAAPAPAEPAPAPAAKDTPAKQDAAPAASKPAPAAKVDAAQAKPPPAKAKKAAAAKAQADQPNTEIVTEPGPIERFMKEWDSKLAVGLNGASGDNELQNVYLRFSTKHQSDADRWLISAQWFYGKSNGDTTQNQVNADVTKDWLAKDNPWFFFVRGQYKRDQFRSWSHRTSGFGGAGYTFVKDDSVELNGRLGFGGTYEFGDVDEFTPEALFGGTIMKWQINDRQTLAGELTWFPSLDDEDQHRLVSKFWWKYALDVLDGLALKVGVENEYDSSPHADDDANDFKYYAAIVLDF